MVITCYINKYLNSNSVYDIYVIENKNNLKQIEQNMETIH